MITFILIVGLIFVGVFLFCCWLNLRKLIKLFRSGSVSVCGLRGRGKDMLIANIIARRKEGYISNVDYKCKGCKFVPLRMDYLDVRNNYRNFIYHNINKYEYSYPLGYDIYISDVGVYFPAQYNGELNKEFKQFPVFMALSRQLGECNVHTNTQALQRPWDKLREQSDIYVRCERCVYLGKKFRWLPLVIQTVTLYDKFESAQDAVDPYEHIKSPASISSKVRAEYKARDRAAARDFRERRGKVRRMTLIYFNKSNYDTHIFRTILKGGDVDEK